MIKKRITLRTNEDLVNQKYRFYQTLQGRNLKQIKNPNSPVAVLNENTLDARKDYFKHLNALNKINRARLDGVFKVRPSAYCIKVGGFRATNTFFILNTSSVGGVVNQK